MDGERRAVLRGIAALTGIAVGSSGASGVGATDPAGRQVDVRLRSGVTLFDLDGDGEYAATVERASEPVRDDDHPRPIHVTSDGRSTVDYAVAVAEPPTETTLGGLDRLSYDYYAGSDRTTAAGDDETDSESDGTASDANGGTGPGADGGPDPGSPPGDPFLVVENDDGRHGASLGSAGAGGSDDGSDSTGEGWSTVDVLARMTGETGERRWYEYTPVEDGSGGESFDDVIERFGEEATLALVGVGFGNAVTPTILDAYFDNLAVGGETLRFPTSVVNRVS